ncbi:hypothetical protein LY90DRAFT_511282 [Neocallimastix californiae]|uniref:Myb-like domain-containing protein n=1 Tax=Neocallimastix californiae TaxID=1754190 RepID=A0A1Y2BRG3_9FUNG|nr:hypothetical protein LY90DRAFT_511282 [Neocallimastix californiae]|eukprot:ORY37348.1 hypothetical protein LY90DRAFT_511282 [Neocallimastix californiae]
MTSSTSSNEYKWSTYECIVLAQAFLKFGEDHWKDISKILTKTLEPRDGNDIFSQANCQNKFNSLLNEYIKSEEKISSNNNNESYYKYLYVKLIIVLLYIKKYLKSNYSKSKTINY